MNLEARKIEFVQEFFKLRSEKAISKFEKLLKQEKEDASKERAQVMAAEVLNARIDESLQDSRTAKFTDADDLIIEIDQWD